MILWIKNSVIIPCFESPEGFETTDETIPGPVPKPIPSRSSEGVIGPFEVIAKIFKVI